MNDTAQSSPNRLPAVSAWPRNLWYVACWSEQLDDSAVVACKTAGESVVIYRKADGDVVALEDRCAHRSAPLSLGKREGDEIRCMYHGFRWGPDGRCTEIPVQRSIPPRACVRNYPVMDIDGWVWIWPGDPARADASLIPRSFGIADPQLRTISGQMSYSADFQLLNDNLLDLSHLAFLHPSTLGADTPQWGTITPTAEAIPRGVRVQRWIPGRKAPFYLAGGGATFDMWSSYDFVAPGIFMITSSLYPLGTAEAAAHRPPTSEPLTVRKGKQAVTPVEEGSLRYFYAIGMRREEVDQELLEKIFAVTYAAFEEDKTMIEAQQRVLHRTGGAAMVLAAVDAAPVMFRRVMSELLRQDGAAN